MDYGRGFYDSTQSLFCVRLQRGVLKHVIYPFIYVYNFKYLLYIKNHTLLMNIMKRGF